MSLQIACLVIGIVTLIALLLPVTKFRRSHKNFCIVSVFMILLHHYQVGSEETKAFPQHYSATNKHFLGTDLSRSLFNGNEKVKVKYNAHTTRSPY